VKVFKEGLPGERERCIWDTLSVKTSIEDKPGEPCLASVAAGGYAALLSVIIARRTPDERPSTKQRRSHTSTRMEGILFPS